jgi:V8-like Glu-specific endopeptidase
MSWDAPQLASLRRVVAELYPLQSDQRRLVTEVGLRQAAIQFDPPADNSWFFILQYAKAQSKIDALVDKLIEENEGNELLRRIKEQGAVPTVAGSDIKKDVTWKGPANAQPLLEKITGSRSALVPVSFLAVGLRRARSVAKVQLANGVSGSGFLVTGNLLITNHHVLPDKDSAKTAAAQFNYQQTPDGADEPMESFGLEPDAFFASSEKDDWSAVRVAGDAAAKWGALALRKATVQKDDRVNIVQHPGGGPKQVSYFSNVVVYAGEGRVQYLTDTLPGSSGSPVFDRDWNVVALHHSGGWLVEPGSSDKTTYYRNEGILIDVIMDGIQAATKAAG